MPRPRHVILARHPSLDAAMFRCLFLLSCALLTACGLKGPLYLPDRSKPAVVTPAPDKTETPATPVNAEPASNVPEGEEDSKTKQAK